NLCLFNDTATTEIYTLSLHDALPINDTATTEIYTLSLHDALPISVVAGSLRYTARPAADRDRPSGHLVALRPGIEVVGTVRHPGQDRHPVGVRGGVDAAAVRRHIDDVGAGYGLPVRILDGNRDPGRVGADGHRDAAGG